MKSQQERIVLNVNRNKTESKINQDLKNFPSNTIFKKTENYLGTWKLIGNERKPKTENDIFDSTNKDLQQIPTWNSSYTLNIKNKKNQMSFNNEETQSKMKLNQENEDGKKTVEKKNLKTKRENLTNKIKNVESDGFIILKNRPTDFNVIQKIKPQRIQITMNNKQVIDNVSQGVYLHSRNPEVKEDDSQKRPNQVSDLEMTDVYYSTKSGINKAQEEDSKEIKSEFNSELKSLPRKKEDLKEKSEKSEDDKSISKNKKKSLELIDIKSLDESDNESSVSSKKQKKTKSNLKNKINPLLVNFGEKLNEEELVKIRYERIRLLWNHNYPSILKHAPNLKRIPKFENFLKKHSHVSEKNKKTLVRLALNRMDFILQRLVVKGKDSRNLFSVFDEFMTFVIIIVNNEKKTGTIAKLLASYLGRSINTVRAQTQRMNRIMNVTSQYYLYNSVVRDKLRELSQEVKLLSSLKDTMLLKDRRTRVVRFSFSIDLFLLILYKELGLPEYVDDFEILQEVHAALKEKRRINVSRTDNWSERMYNEKQFVKKFSMMFNNEEEYLKFIEDLEDMIIKSGFLKNFENDILTENSLNFENVSDKKSQDSQEIKSEFKDKENASHTESSLSQESKNSKKSEKESLSRVDESENKQNGSIQRSQTPLEELRKRVFVSYDLNKSSCDVSISNNNSNNKILKLKVEHILFTNWGIDQIKSRFNFDRIEVENLTISERIALINLIQLLNMDPYNSQFSSYLMIVTGCRPQSIKEYIRNLNIYLRLIRTLPNIVLSLDIKLNLINISYKIQKIIKFIRTKFFYQKQVFRSKTVRRDIINSNLF